MVRSEGNMSLKNTVTPPGIDPGTVRLGTQRLNHYTIPGPKEILYLDGNYFFKRCFLLKIQFREIFSLGAESTPRAMVRSEGNMSLKNTVTPPGIDPGTVPLGAQRLNHYAVPGPKEILYLDGNYFFKRFFFAQNSVPRNISKEIM